MRASDTLQGWIPAIGAAIPMIILPIAILSIPLSAASDMGLSPAELSSWIVALYGLPGALSVLLALRYRQPLLLTGNVFVLIFFVSLEGRHSLAELVGASVIAGIGVLAISLLGLTGRLSRLIPPPVVLGLLAGAVLPFVVDVFTMLDDDLTMIGGTILAYILGQRYLDSRLPPIFPALITGVAIAAVRGDVGPPPEAIPWPSLVATRPELSLESIATVAPILIVLVTLQSNVPSMVFLRTQGYQPDERALDRISGVSTAIGSLFGPTGVSLSLPATSLVAGPHAGDPALRHRAVYIAGAAVVVVALLSGIAADLPSIIPIELLLALAGLAVIGILAHALRQMTEGPLTLGPLFAFAIALSDMTVLGFGPFFWGIVIGTGVSMLLERDALRQMRESTTQR